MKKPLRLVAVVCIGATGQRRNAIVAYSNLSRASVVALNSNSSIRESKILAEYVDYKTFRRKAKTTDEQS